MTFLAAECECECFHHYLNCRDICRWWVDESRDLTAMTMHLDSGVGGLFKMALTFISQNVDFFSSPTHPSHIFFFFSFLFSSFYSHSLFFSSYRTVTVSVTIEHVQFRRKKGWDGGEIML